MKTDFAALVEDEMGRILGKPLFESAGILAVYLFGSGIRGELTSESDIDLAFLVSDESYKADPLTAMSPCHLAAGILGRTLDRETDVTVLNGASLEMAYEAISSGECVFESDRDKRFEYEAALRGMYFDFRPFLDEARKVAMARL